MASDRPFPFSVDDTWFRLNLAFSNLVLTNAFFLWKCFASTVLITLCICFGICLSSNWFCLRLAFFFFLFSNLGLIMAQENSIHVNCFMTGDEDFVPFYLKMHIVGEGPGETPPALRCFFYLIRSLLTRKSHGWRSLVGCSPWGH